MCVWLFRLCILNVYDIGMDNFFWPKRVANRPSLTSFVLGTSFCVVSVTNLVTMNVPYDLVFSLNHIPFVLAAIVLARPTVVGPKELMFFLQLQHFPQCWLAVQLASPRP